MKLCPYKPDFECKATPDLAKQSRCVNCPYVPQYILVEIYLDLKHNRGVRV